MRKLELKFGVILLILLAASNVFGAESNQSQNFYGAMEQKIETFSDLISFDPQTISTDCSEVREKYEEYSEAMAFTHGVNDEMMTETMQNLGKLRTIGHELNDQVDETNELALRQEKLLELRAERKVEEMKWREDWNKRHLEMERERQKILSASFVQTNIQARLEDIENEINQKETESQKLEIDAQIYEQKIYQFQQEISTMQSELDQYDEQTQIITDTANQYSNEIQKLEEMKAQAQTQEEIDKIQEQEKLIVEQHNQLVQQAGDLTVKRNAIVMKLMKKQEDIQTYAAQQSEISQQRMQISYEVTELKTEQTTVSSYETYSTTTTSSSSSSSSTTSSYSYSSSSSSTTTTTSSYSSEVSYFTQSYYELETQSKEIEVQRTIITQNIQEYQSLVEGYETQTYLTEEQQADKEVYTQLLNQSETQIITLEQQTETIQGQMKQEEDNLATSGNINPKDEQLPYTEIDTTTITSGQYSKLYYLFKARIIQVKERIEVIITKLQEITTQIEQIQDEAQLTKLTNEKSELENEKIYREKELAQLEAYITNEEANYSQNTTTEINYSEQYYFYKKQYDANYIKIETIVIQIIQIENEILKLQSSLETLDDISSMSVYSEIETKTQQKITLQGEKEALLMQQEELQKGMSEEIEKMENEAASQKTTQQTASEKLIMYIKRYNEIGFELKTIFSSLQDYRNKIDVIFEQIASGTYEETSSQFELVASYRLEIQNLEIQQVSLRQQQETIISQITILVNEAQKAKELEYLEKYAESFNITFPYQLSAITTLSCDFDNSYNVSSTSTLDNQQQQEQMDISSISTLDGQETTKQTTEISESYNISSTSTLDDQQNVAQQQQQEQMDVSSISTLDGQSTSNENAQITEESYNISSTSTLDDQQNVNQQQQSEQIDASSISTLDGQQIINQTTEISESYDISSTSTLDNQQNTQQQEQIDASSISTLDGQSNGNQIDVAATSTYNSQQEQQEQYSASSISTLDSNENSYSYSDASTLDNTQQDYYQSSSVSTYDNQNLLKKHQKVHHPKMAKSFLEFPDPIKLQYSNLAILLQQNIPCESHSEGVIDFDNVKVTSIKYSAHYYELLIQMEELLINYQTLIKSYFEMKKTIFRLTIQKQKGIPNETGEDIVSLEEELQQKQTEETQLKIQIEMIQKEIEMERIEALDQAIKQDFSEVLHALILNFAKIKVQYKLTIIRMQAITTIKQLIFKHTTQIFDEFQASQYSFILYQQYGFELYWLNLFMIELDKQSIKINELKMTYFGQLKKLLFQISQEKAANIGEESIFTIDETTSTGITETTTTTETIVDTDGMNKLQKALIRLSTTIDYNTRIILLKKIIMLYKQRKSDLMLRRFYLQKYIREFNFKIAYIDANITYFNGYVNANQEEITILKQHKYNQSQLVKNYIKEFQDQIYLFNNQTKIISAAAQPFQQQLQIYQYSFDQIQQQIMTIEAYIQQYEEQLNQIQSGEVADELQQGFESFNIDGTAGVIQNTEKLEQAASELTNQIEGLLIDIEDPNKDDCEKEQIQQQLISLIEQQMTIAENAYIDQYSVVFGMEQQIFSAQQDIYYVESQITWFETMIAEAEDAIEYYTYYGNNQMVEYYQGQIPYYESQISSLQSQLPVLEASLSDLNSQLIVEEQELSILDSDLLYWLDLYCDIYSLMFNCQSQTSVEQTNVEQAIAKSTVINETEIQNLIKEVQDKKNEMESIQLDNQVDYSVLQQIQPNHENYNEYKKLMISNIPSKVEETQKLSDSINKFDISKLEDKLTKLNKLHSYSQNVLVAYAKLQEDSDLHKKSIQQTKIIRIAIQMIENLVKSKKFIINNCQLKIDLLNKKYEKLTKSSESVKIEETKEQQPEMEEAMTGEFNSLDEIADQIINNEKATETLLGLTLSSQTQAMIDYYWQNEASLSDCEKADLLYDIADRLLNVDYDDTVDVWEYEQGLANDLYDYVENDQYHVTLYTTALQNSYDDVEEYEDLVDYYTYYGNQQMVEMYEQLIDLEENYYQPMYQANITYWQGILATDQAIYNTQQAIADAADQDIEDLIDLWVYYEDLWLTYYMLCAGRGQNIIGAESPELSQDYLENKILLIDSEFKLTSSLFDLQIPQDIHQKIETINQLIPIIKQIITLRVQDQVNFTTEILSIQIQLASKRGEQAAKEKAIEYFKTLDQTIYNERIAQYTQNLLTVQSEKEQLQIMLDQQNLYNEKKIKNIYGLQSYLVWLEAELVKLQVGYDQEFGKYTKYEVATGFSHSEINQTIVDKQFTSYLYSLSNTEYNISQRIAVFRKIIFYLQAYIANITIMTNQFNSYLVLLKSGQSKLESQITTIQQEFNQKESELNQNTELKEYYIQQGMQERSQEIEEVLIKIREEYDLLKKKLVSIQLSLTIYQNSIAMYNFRLNFRTQQLNYINNQLNLFQQELNSLQTSYYTIQTTTTVVSSASDSTEVTTLENYLKELSVQEISITTRILKITKIITIIKSQITVITKKYNTIKFEIEKLTAKQFELKLQIGSSQAQYDSYMIKITTIETQIQQFTGSQDQLAYLQSQLTLFKQQSQTYWSQIQTLNITYVQIQTQIDTYLIEVNAYSEQLIKYKEQLLTYQGQIKELNEEQKKNEQEQTEKTQEKQEEQEKNLEDQKKKIEDMKDDLEDKKKERDIACKIPTEPEPEVPQPQGTTEVYEEEDHPAEPHEEEKPKRTYEAMDWNDEEEKPQEYQPRIDGAQKGFDVRIPGNPYTPPKQRPEEEIYRKPKTDKRYDYGWDQFMREKEEERKNQNLTLAQPEERIPYENVEEGVYRIKRRLHDILNYEFGDDEFFVQIKTTVERYMKVLVEKEHVLKKKEIHIKERSIKIENTERRIEHKAEIVKQDLEKCQLDFPEVRKKAETIKSENYTAVLEKKIEEKKKELEEQKEANKKAEEEVIELEEKVQDDEKQVEVREEKIIQTYPEEFHYEAPTKHRRPREFGSDEPLPDYVPTKSWTPPEATPAPTLKEPETEKEKEQEKLTEEEDKLDEQIEETEDVDVITPIEDVKKVEEKKIEEKQEEIKVEEKKIEEEKKKLVEEKQKLDEQIEQCKLDYGNENDNQTPEQKQVYENCVANRDQFDQDQMKLESQIQQYEDLFKELQEEKSQFQAQKDAQFSVSGAHTERQEQITGITTAGAHSENQEYNNNIIVSGSHVDSQPIPVYAEIKKNVHKQALWKHINKQLKLVNDLAQSNSKQQKNLENKMKNSQIYDKEHLAAIKSMKYIQSFTEKIAAKLSLILSEYPEDRDKLREMTAEVVTEIDRLYELAMKQRRIISSINTLREKQRELLTMKTNCLQAEKLLNQPSFLQNLLQMNYRGKKNLKKY